MRRLRQFLTTDSDIHVWGQVGQEILQEKRDFEQGSILADDFLELPISER
jgi:hypothetical protein